MVCESLQSEMLKNTAQSHLPAASSMWRPWKSAHRSEKLRAFLLDLKTLSVCHFFDRCFDFREGISWSQKSQNPKLAAEHYFMIFQDLQKNDLLDCQFGSDDCCRPGFQSQSNKRLETQPGKKETGQHRLHQISGLLLSLFKVKMFLRCPTCYIFLHTP